jgi:hypothetical protein
MDFQQNQVRNFRNHVAILPTFYVQLLHMQIPKAQKIQSSCQSLFALLGSAHIKAASKMLVKLTPGQQLILCLYIKK